MKKSVGYFTDDKLQELAEKPNTIVMTPTHDTVFEPWPAARVASMLDMISTITKRMKSQSSEEIQDYCKSHPDMHEFSEKYQVMFKKITDPLFVQDDENLKVMKKLVLLKAAVDNNLTTSEQAQAEAADLALKSLVSRVKNSS